MARGEQHADERARGAAAAPRARADLGAGLALALGAVGATWRLLALPASYVLVGLVLYAALTILVLRALPSGLPGPGLGAANRVTLGRAALALPVLALALLPGTLGRAGHWWVIVLSTVVMLLDGVDGRIARRSGTQSAFGARFDMELDAALILALSVLAWRSGAVGPWVLLIGLMRYAFVAASWIRPALRAPLPPSERRRIVCVLQGVALLVALGPVVPSTLAVAVTALALAALTYSFAVDAGWALRHGEKGAAAR